MYSETELIFGICRKTKWQINLIGRVFRRRGHAIVAEFNFRYEI